MAKVEMRTAIGLPVAIEAAVDALRTADARITTETVAGRLPLAQLLFNAEATARYVLREAVFAEIQTAFNEGRETGLAEAKANANR